jgi:hypothetical protein
MHGKIVESGAAALLFAAIFLFGGHVHPLRAVARDDRSLVSFAAGASVAYVFVYAIPELHDARRIFATSVSISLRYEGMAIFLIALVGFLVFYGLDHFRAQLRRRPTAVGQDDLAYRLHIGGFAVYVWLMAYLLVNSLDETPGSTALYTVAIAGHFLALDHSLLNEHRAAYERTGRFTLAGMSVLGWGVGLLFALPRYGLALLVAFISGAIIMNSTIMELPSEKDGRFLAFMAGGVVYGLILLPLG